MEMLLRARKETQMDEVGPAETGLLCGIYAAQKYTLNCCPIFPFFKRNWNLLLKC